jgi:4a-hydroxytetrahydrobiopterin dehydratase
MGCTPCRGGVAPLEGAELKCWHDKLGGEWELVDAHHISRSFSCSSFSKAIEFTNKIAELAEQVGHHPIILINFNKVTLDIWTHKIDGLADADFIFAAKADDLFTN